MPRHMANESSPRVVREIRGDADTPCMRIPDTPHTKSRCRISSRVFPPQGIQESATRGWSGFNLWGQSVNDAIIVSKEHPFALTLKRSLEQPAGISLPAKKQRCLTSHLRAAVFSTEVVEFPLEIFPRVHVSFFHCVFNRLSVKGASATSYGPATHEVGV